MGKKPAKRGPKPQRSPSLPAESSADPLMAFRLGPSRRVACRERALAEYSGLSVRKLREHLADPTHPLPHYRVGGKIVVRRSEFDTWMARYRRVGQPNVERIVSEVLAGV